MAQLNAGYGFNWYKAPPAGDLAPDVVVTPGSQLFGRITSVDRFPRYLTAHVVRKTWWRRSWHRARPNFKESGVPLPVGRRNGNSAVTDTAMTVSTARELASVTGYRLYDPWRNRSPLVFAGNQARVGVTEPTGGAGTAEVGGNLATGEVSLAIERPGRKTIVGEVNVGIDPTIELNVLSLRDGPWMNVLDFVDQAFRDAYDGWLSAENPDPPRPDELMDAFRVEYQEYLAPNSAQGWEFVVEPEIIEAQQGTRELFTLTLQAPADAVPTLFAVAVRDVKGSDGVFDTSELVLVHPVDAE
jgi:hypothetical protein